MIRKFLKPFAFILGSMLFSSSFAQTVAGHWYGIGTLQTSLTYQSYLSELVLQQKGKLVTGTFHYYFRDSLVKVSVNGSFDDEMHHLSIRPFKMIYYLSPSAANSIDCFMSGGFTLVASKAESVLSGKLMSDADHKYTVPNISFRLKRSDDTLDWVKTPEPELKHDTTPVLAAATAVETKTQETETIEEFGRRSKLYTKEIEVTGPTLRLELYDNGQIDYDSVSVFFNNKLILPKTKLDHRAIRLNIQLDPSLEYNELSMFAENLGMIPPNTAALIIYDGKNRYETLLSSDLSTSATIKLKRKQ